MFNANIANNVSTWIGATAIVSQDTLSTGEQTDVMSGIIAIQETLTDMQTTLNTLAGTEAPAEITPVVEVVPEVTTE